MIFMGKRHDNCQKKPPASAPAETGVRVREELLQGFLRRKRVDELMG